MRDSSSVAEVHVVEGDVDGPVVLYRQEPDHRIRGVFLDEGVYAQAIGSFVIVCTDVVLYDKRSKKVYLATRRHLPMKGLWWVGGRMRAGETAMQAVLRNLQQETGLTPRAEDLEVFDWMPRYHWSERQQAPQEMGSDNLSYMFALPVTPSEATKACRNLDDIEYEAALGLSPFGREDLERLLYEGSLHPVIMDVYNSLFPGRFRRFRRWLAGLID